MTTLTKPAAILRREAASEYVGLSVQMMQRLMEEWAESRPVSDLPPPPNTGRK